MTLDYYRLTIPQVKKQESPFALLTANAKLSEYLPK